MVHGRQDTRNFRPVTGEHDPAIQAEPCRKTLQLLQERLVANKQALHAWKPLRQQAHGMRKRV